MKQMLRFEILLPLYYNDGRQIELERFVQTDEEIVAQFGATSTDAVVVKGHWKYRSTFYEDRLIRLRVDAQNSKKNITFFRQYKEVLKTRFEQEDIWITAQQINVI